MENQNILFDNLFELISGIVILIIIITFFVIAWRLKKIHSLNTPGHSAWMQKRIVEAKSADDAGLHKEALKIYNCVIHYNDNCEYPGNLDLGPHNISEIKSRVEELMNEE